MRQLIISFCFIMAALSIEAASINGIRIESAGEPIIVFIDGQQMCTPSVSCFIANLRGGSYKIEVYGTQSSRRGEQARKGKLIYEERVDYRGSGVKDIIVEHRQRPRPDRPNRPGREEVEMKIPYRPMTDNAFNEFFKTYQSKIFDSEREALLDNVLITSSFTTKQFKSIIDLYNFDSDRVKLIKKVYPNIVDHENFFVIVGTLDHNSDIKEVNEFIKKYHEEEDGLIY